MTIEVTKGSSYAFGIDRLLDSASVDLTGYSCAIRITSADGTDGIDIQRAVTEKSADSRSFLANITPAETGTMTVHKEYVVSYKLSNPAINYAGEGSFNILIKRSRF